MKKKLIVTLMLIALAVSLCGCTDENVKGRVKGLADVNITIDTFCADGIKETVKDALNASVQEETEITEPAVGAETSIEETETAAVVKDAVNTDVASTDKKSDKEAVAAVSNTADKDAEKPDADNTATATAKPDADNTVTATAKPAETAKNEPAPAQPAQTPDKPAEKPTQQTTQTQPASQPTQEYTPTITMNGTDIDITDWTDEQKQAHDQATLDAIGDAIMSGNDADLDAAIGMGLTGSCTMQ